MGRKEKRVPKKTTRSDLMDAQTPIDISTIGTDDDPCFGKLYEPVTEECSTCGDSELCAIMHMHTLDKKRDKLNKKQNFKDQEEAVKTPTFMSTSVLRDKIELKLEKESIMRFTKITQWISKKFDSKDLLPPGRVSELCKYAIKSSKKLKAVKKHGKVYIRHVA